MTFFSFGNSYLIQSGFALRDLNEPYKSAEVEYGGTGDTVFGFWTSC